MDKHLSQAINNLIQLHQSDKHQQAFTGYQELLVHHPHEPQLHHLVGIYFAQTNHPSKAQESIEKAIALDPDEPSYQVSLANVIKAQGNIEQANAILKKIMEAHPHFISAKINLASSYIKMNQHSLARPLLDELLAQQLPIANIHYLKALTDIACGDVEHGITHLQKALELEPEHLPTCKQLAKSLHQAGRQAEARPLYEKAVNLFPNDAEFKQCAAINALELEEDDQALTWLVEVLAMAPKTENINHNLASIYLNKGLFREALHHFLRELENGDDIEVIYNIGVTYQYLNRLDDARDFFTRVLERDPKHLGALINLGANALQNYNSKAAIHYYQSALQIKPNDPSITYVLKALQGKQETGEAPTEYVENLFDQYAGHYDRHLLDMLNYQVPKHIPRLINDHFPAKKASIIDLGCGTGLMGEWLKPFANRLIGIDLSEKMVKEARKKSLYDELHVLNVLDYDATQADILVGADILPYIGNCQPFFEWCQKRLNKGGILCVSFEKNTQNDHYFLQNSARFCHHLDYILSIATSLGFEVCANESLMLRKQLGEPLQGTLLCLRI